MKQQLDLEVKEFFDILSHTSSTLMKKQLLAERKGDANIRKFLDYLLNPFFVTGISEKKISRPATKEPTLSFASFHELMPYIRENHTGSDEVLANVQAFLASTDADLRDFYVGIITKTIRIGCDVKTVNDALGFELIPMWEVQQAYQINKVQLNDNEWFSLSQKLNGVRGTFFEGKLISRQGKEFVGLDHIIHDISELIYGCEDWVLDLCILLVRPIRERVLGTKDIREGQKCLLRAEMLRIYYSNREKNTIRQHEKENFIYMYKAYKALGGNSFIDDIYEEIRHWEVIT